MMLVVPLTVIIGVVVFSDRMYAWISLAIAVITVAALLLSMEKKQADVQKIILISVMVSLSVAGRALCAWLPHFNPVTAIVIVTGIYLGSEAGFICGAFSALLSNFVFGQGPWTPFQMFSWGMIGLLAALLSKSLKNSRIMLILFGATSGMLYSLIMDIWTALWLDGTLNFSRYIVALISSSPVMVVYVISNILFLLLLAKPIGDKLGRIITKYGI